MSSCPNTPRSLPSSPLPAAPAPHVFPHHPPPPTPNLDIEQSRPRGVLSLFPVTSPQDTGQPSPFPSHDDGQKPKRPGILHANSSHSSGLRVGMPISSAAHSSPCRTHTTSGGSQLSALPGPCYFSPRPGRSTRPREQVSLQTNRLATPTPSGKSPLASSVGSSYISKRTDSSLFNLSSGNLSPPPFQSGDEAPPYRARADSRSLKMVPKLARSKSTPILGQAHTTKEGRKIHKRHRRRHIHKERAKYSSPQTSDLKSNPGQHERMQNWHGQFPRNSKMDTSTSNFPRAQSDHLPSQSSEALVGRKWSSGQHEDLTRANLEAMSRMYKNQSPQATSLYGDTTIASEGKITDFATGSDGDVVTAIRQILTLRRVESNPPEPPTSIILRRASKQVEASDTHSKCHSPVDAHAEDRSCNSHLAGDLYNRRASGRFLITSEDVESITNLVDKQVQERRPPIFFDTYSPSKIANTSVRSPGVASTFQNATPNAFTSHHVSPALQRKGRKCKRKSTKTSDSPESGRSKRTPSQIIHDALWGGSYSPGDSSGGSSDELPAQFDFLEKGFWSHRQKDKRSRSSTQQSVHEVVWKPGLSPLGTPFTPCKLSDMDSFVSEPVTPGDPPPTRLSHIPNPGRPGASYFPTMRDSSMASLLKYGKGPNDLPELNDQAERLEGRVTGRSRITRSKKIQASKSSRQPWLMVSEPQLAAVASFPPLAPRKTTLEWRSPLPDIEIRQCSLYDLGLDMHRGLPQTSPTTITPKRASWAVPIARATLPLFGNESQPQLPMRAETISSKIAFRRALTVQPKAAPQIAISSEVGQSIDTCAGDRRRSSVKIMQRVRTVDSVRKAVKESGWKQRRQPSVCPLPLPPSPSESASDSGLKLDIPSNPILGSSATRESERMALLQQKSPQTPTIDRVGIYRGFTGTLTTVRHGSRDCDEREGCRSDSSDLRTPSVDWIA